MRARTHTVSAAAQHSAVSAAMLHTLLPFSQIKLSSEGKKYRSEPEEGKRPGEEEEQ